MEESQAPRACPGGRGPGEVTKSVSSAAIPRSALPVRLHRRHHALVEEIRRPCPHLATRGACGIRGPPREAEGSAAPSSTTGSAPPSQA
eukprot:9738403-Alexandrium_andersonii.AAC.1